MERKKFTELPQPFTCVMISDAELADAVNTIKTSEFHGADSYILNLMGDGKMGLKAKYLNPRDLKRIMTCTIKPIMACFYRWHYLRGPLSATDEERKAILIEAVKAGAKCIDMEGDFFDEVPGPQVFTEESKKYSLTRGNPPREVSYKAEAIARQKEFIQEVQSYGAEVQMSIHSRIHLSPDHAVELGKEMERRGADIVKVVSVDLSYEDLMDTLMATVRLKKELKIPFIMMSHGEHSSFGRWFAPFLGSMLCFCQEYFVSDGFYLQPLVREVKTVFDTVSNIYPTKDPQDNMWL